MATEHLDSGGNPKVDFVWGNMPMQPNYGRSDSWIYFGGGNGSGDNGWSSAGKYISDTLNTSYTRYINGGFTGPYIVNTNHTMVYDGYSNFPGFIENYAGDEDSDLETVVPAIVGLDRYAAGNKLNAAFLDWDYDWNSIGALGITADLTQSSDALVFVDGDFWLTEGLKVGDKLWFNWYDGSGYSKIVTIKEKKESTSELLVTFDDGPFNDIDTGDTYNKSVEIDGNFMAAQGTYDRVLAVDTPPSAGAIVNEGTGIWFYVLAD